MERLEFDPEEHEKFVSRRLEIARMKIARYALFDQMCDYYLNGDCTLEQAMIEFMHDATEAGIGYEAA